MHYNDSGQLDKMIIPIRASVLHETNAPTAYATSIPNVIKSCRAGSLLAKV